LSFVVDGGASLKMTNDNRTLNNEQFLHIF